MQNFTPVKFLSNFKHQNFAEISSGVMLFLRCKPQLYNQANDPFLCMLEVNFRCTSTEGCDVTGVPVDGLEELALVCANFAGVDLLNEFRVFVNEPRFAQDVRRCVLQLQQPNVQVDNNNTTIWKRDQNVTTSDLIIYTIVSVNSLRLETACYTHKKQLYRSSSL